MTDWTPEMDEAFNEIEKRSNLGKQILTAMKPQDEWIGLIRGVRVEGDTVVVHAKNNDEARCLCHCLIHEMERRRGQG